MCEDQAAMRQFMRLRGYTLMANLLEDFFEDSEVCTAVSTIIVVSSVHYEHLFLRSLRVFESGRCFNAIRSMIPKLKGQLRN